MLGNIHIRAVGVLREILIVSQQLRHLPDTEVLERIFERATTLAGLAPDARCVEHASGNVSVLSVERKAISIIDCSKALLTGKSTATHL